MKKNTSAPVLLLGVLLGSAVSTVITVLFSARTSSADDFVIPQRFAPGDLLSADQFNELFDEIEAANSSPREADLVGRWRCQAYHYAHFADADPVERTPEWTIEPVADGWDLIKLEGIEITFSEDDGAFSFTTSAPDPFMPRRPDPLTSTFRIVGDALFYRGIINDPDGVDPDTTFMYAMSIKKSGQNRFTLHNTCGFQGCAATAMLWCDRLDVPPPPPQSLAASVEDADVALTWSFSGPEEASFRVLRKAALEDGFESLAETAAGETTYADQPEGPGTYWYRVIAVGEFGDSLGSNEVSVTLE